MILYGQAAAPKSTSSAARQLTIVTLNTNQWRPSQIDGSTGNAATGSPNKRVEHW
jgi:hypothetical protein